MIVFVEASLMVSPLGNVSSHRLTVALGKNIHAISVLSSLFPHLDMTHCIILSQSPT